MKFYVYYNGDDEVILNDMKGVVQTPIENIVVQMFDDDENRVTYGDILRIPSSKNPANQFSVPAGYQMCDMMSADNSEALYILSHVMGVNKDFDCSGVRKNLANSDLYFLRGFFTEMGKQDKGYEEMFLSRISEQIQSIKRDPHPVIVASPCVTQDCWCISSAPGETDKMEKILLNAGFQPIQDSNWYYLTK